ncbi:MAG: tetratricopeptide repeat protein [Paludibacteraceae bacterium]|nr:tetratricopeptide repeat protein [Paludibacteraceae bacterium]MBR6311046.1 tetratricopeptide repeat protein [Paludibacteraceae bacterium]
MSFRKIILTLGTLLACITATAGNKKSDQHAEHERRRFSYFFQEAVKQRLLGNYSIAGDLLQKCYYINPKDDALLRETSELYKQAGDTKNAAIYAYLAYTAAPDNYWQSTHAAEMMLAINNIQATTSILEESIKKHPKEDNCYYALVGIYERMQQYEKAIEVLNKYEKNNGIQEEISLEKYKCYSALKQNEKAFKEIENLANAFPHETRYRLMTADIYYESGEKEKALGIYKNVLSQEPENGIALLALAKHYELTGEKEKAVTEMEKALRSSSVDFETKVSILGEFLNYVQERDEWKTRILTLFESLEDTYPEVADVHYFYASYYIAIQNYAAATSQLRKAIALAPDNKDYYYMIIELMASDKSESHSTVDSTALTNECIQFIDSAKSRFPDEAKFYFYEASIHLTEKDYDKAQKQIEAGIAIANRQKDAQISSQLYGMLGDIFHETGKKEEAYDAYENGLKFSSTNTQILNNYSYYLAEEGKDLEKAEKMIKLCLKIEPGNTNAIDTYAWVLFKQGFYHLAKQNIERLTSLTNLSPESMQVIWEHYGDILYKTGDAPKAIEAWKKSAELGNKSKTNAKKIELGKYVEE